jgi:hypothetical protein
MAVMAAEGELSPSDETRLRAHLAGCAACRAFAAELAGFRTALDDLAPPDPGEAFFAAARERIYAEHRRPREEPSLGARLRALFASLREWVSLERRALGATAMSAVAAVLLVLALWPRGADSPLFGPGPTVIPPPAELANGDEMTDAELQAEIGSLNREEIKTLSGKLVIDGGDITGAIVDEEAEGIDALIETLSAEEMNRLNQQLKVAVKEAKGA